MQKHRANLPEVHKTTVYLPDELKRSLARLAAETSDSEASLIREAVADLVAAAQLGPRADSPTLRIASSGHRTTGGRAPRRRLTEVIVLDTSGLLAALDASEPDHDACREVLLADDGPRHLSPFVLAEADLLLSRHRGSEAARGLLCAVEAGEYRMATFENADIGRCQAVMARYRERAMSIADASLLVLAHRYGTDRILTLEERLFRDLAPIGGGPAFILLPADS